MFGRRKISKLKSIVLIKDGIINDLKQDIISKELEIKILKDLLHLSKKELENGENK